MVPGPGLRSAVGVAPRPGPGVCYNPLVANAFDLDCLALALREADTRRGFCAPNPSVGAVVARDGAILARGHHRAAGAPHAEVEALAALPDAKGATVYVTLEPCCHFGRTPPCSRLLIERGVARVVYAFRDPNPKVDGGGASELARAGILTEHVATDAIDEFYRGYAHWTRTALPFVTTKLAISLDGRTALPGNRPVKLTGPEADRRTHEARRRADAILTTARTVRADDPRLDARVETGTVRKPLYVLDRELSLGPTARILETAERLTLFHGPCPPEEAAKRLLSRGARLVELAPGEGGLALDAALRHIGADGVHDLWVEAGATLFRRLARLPGPGRVVLYVSPIWLGGDAPAALGSEEGGAVRDFSERFRQIRWEISGRDAVLTLEH